MKFRFFLFITLSLCLFFGYSKNAIATEEVTGSKLLTTAKNPAQNVNLLGSSVPKSSDFIQSGIKGIIYCLSLLLLAYGLKRKMGSKKTTDKENLISLIAQKNLGQRCSLLLVQVDGKRLLLSHSLDCLSLISELDDLNYLNDKVESFEKNLTLAVNE